MRRRGLLIGLGSLCGVLLTWRYFDSRSQDAIAAVIHKRLGYLRLDQAGVRQFAGDLDAKHQISDPKLDLLAASGPLYTRLSLGGSDPASKHITNIEDSIVTSFLLSSDLFSSHDSQDRVVRYVGMFDVLRACSNPFARPAA